MLRGAQVVLRRVEGEGVRPGAVGVLFEGEGVRPGAVSVLAIGTQVGGGDVTDATGGHRVDSSQVDPEQPPKVVVS